MIERSIEASGNEAQVTRVVDLIPSLRTDHPAVGTRWGSRTGISTGRIARQGRRRGCLA